MAQYPDTGSLLAGAFNLSPEELQRLFPPPVAAKPQLGPNTLADAQRAEELRQIEQNRAAFQASMQNGAGRTPQPAGPMATIERGFALPGVARDRIEARPSTPSENINREVTTSYSDLGVPEPVAQAGGTLAELAASMVPWLGGGVAAGDTAALWNRGDRGQALLTGAAAALPGAKIAGKVGKQAAKKIAGGASELLEEPAKQIAKGVEAPAIVSRANPTPEDINTIKAAAKAAGHKPWPTAEREVFATTPEAYGETTKLVPQTSIKGKLPGPLPGEGLPNKGRAEQVILNSSRIGENIADRLHGLVKEESPLLKFYHTGPVLKGLQQHLTPAESVQFMRDWAGQGAATSPRTTTPPNLRNSSFLMYERARGNPLTPERFQREGNTPGYGMMEMHTDFADKFARGVEDPWVNPKPTTFRENWSGNLRDVTADTHNIRSTLYELDRLMPGTLSPHWFTGNDAYMKYLTKGFAGLDPGDILDKLGKTTVDKVPRQAEYLPMAEPWYRAADMLGIEPAQAQSGGWFSYGPVTGLRSPPKTIPNLLNDQLEATAKALGVPTEKVMEWFAKRKIPLASIGVGTGTGLGTMMSDDMREEAA